MRAIARRRCTHNCSAIEAATPNRSSCCHCASRNGLHPCTYHEYTQNSEHASHYAPGDSLRRPVRQGLIVTKVTLSHPHCTGGDCADITMPQGHDEPRA